MDDFEDRRMYRPYEDDPSRWHEALRCCLRSTFPRPIQPHTDEEILLKATYSFYIEGGAGGPGMYSYSYKGASLKPGRTDGKFWVGSKHCPSGKETPPLTGQWLAHAIREAFNIPRKGTLL